MARTTTFSPTNLLSQLKQWYHSASLEGVLANSSSVALASGLPTSIQAGNGSSMVVLRSLILAIV